MSDMSGEMICGLHSSVPDWIIDYPETGRVFEELGIDVSCGGRSLEYVCQRKGIDARVVLERLREVVEGGEI